MPDAPLDALTRRHFLRASMLMLSTSPTWARGSLEHQHWRFLTTDEAATLAVIADIIMPPDNDPGGAWAGVVVFIDRKLAGYHRGSQRLYRAGLASLEASSRALHGRSLAQLDGDTRESLFATLERGGLPAEHWSADAPQRDFFARVVDHTLQGFLGAPRHGGNRDAVSWRMLGLPHPQVRSRRPESPLPPGGNGGRP